MKNSGRLPTVFFCLLTLLAAWPGRSPALAQEWPALLRQAEASAAAGDHAAAAAQADQAVKQGLKELEKTDPRLHQLLETAGAAHERLGEAEKAKRYYHLQLTLTRQDPAADPARIRHLESRLQGLADNVGAATKVVEGIGGSKLQETADQGRRKAAVGEDDDAIAPPQPPLRGEVMVLTPMDPGQALAQVEIEDKAGSDEPLILDQEASKTLADPCLDREVPAAEAPPDPPPAPLPLPAAIQSELGRNVNQLTATYWAAEVSAAREAMRLLHGPLPPEQEAALNRKWAPLFDHPSDRAVAWLRALNPLLVEFQAVQARVATLLEAADSADFEAEMAAAYDHEEETAAALARSRTIVAELRSARTRLEELRGLIEALGDPPDAAADKCQARRRARQAFKDLAPAAPAGARTAPSRPGPACTGNDPLPPEFFSLIPPSYKEAFQARCIHEWLQGGADEPAPQYQVMVNGSLPGTYPGLNIEYDPITIGGGPEKIDWQGSSFRLVLEDNHFKGYTCPNTDPALIYPQRFEISGTLAENGRQLIRLDVERSRLDCECAIENPQDRSCSSWRTVKRDFAYTFTNLPLVKVDPVIFGAGPLGVNLQFEVHGETTISHIGRYAPGSLSRPPLDSNAIVVHLQAVHGAPQPGKEEAPPDLTGEKIAFHENNIKWLQADLARLAAMLAQAEDEASRLAIQYQITCKRADLQAERDAIATLRTGQFTRTPTAWDAMVRGQMLAQGRRMADEIKKAEGNRDRMDRLIAALPPEERAPMRRFLERQLGDRPLDLKKQAEVGRVIAERVQARALEAQAKADEAAAWSQLGMDVCENYQQAATYVMYATPFVSGGSALALIYGITSGGVAGYDQGGIKGAASGAAITALRYWSPKIDYLITAYEGYQEGGAYGAAEKVAITFVKRKITQKITQGLQGYQTRVQAARRQAKLDAWRDAQRRVNFRQEREYGRAMVERHQEIYQQLQAAKRTGAPPARLDELRTQLMDQTAAIKHAPHAKGYLKLSATPAQQRAYNASDRLHTRQTVNELRRDLEAQGFDVNSLNFRPMRNAGNTTPGMDLDLAMTSTGGNFVMRRDPQTGQMQRLSMYEANALVQDRFNRVYARLSGGRSAEASWQQVTTTAHKEAYRDCNWLRVRRLHESGVDPRAYLDPGYAEQAASVTQFKADHMRKFQGMGRDNQNWEIYRGTRKDIDTKIRPLLERRVMEATSPEARSQAVAKLQFYMRLSNAMARADHDPVAAEREIRKLTGHDTLDIVNMVGGSLEALGKWQ